MEITQLIRENLREILKDEYDLEINLDEIELEHPGNESWGDYATNVCFKVSKDLNHSPQEIANEILYRLQDLELTLEINSIQIEIFKNISVAGSGFINFTLSDEFLVSKNITEDISKENFAEFNRNKAFSSQNVLCEYTDPNPFKVFHIGHLMSNAIGESLSRIFEFSGSNLKRVNYQGDVGLHVAKAVWGVFQKLDMASVSSLESLSLDEKVRYLGEAYSIGAVAYEQEDNKAQEEIRYLNTLIYKIAQEMLIEEENWDPVINYDALITEDLEKYPYEKVKQIYKLGRDWSLESFEKVYKRLGTSFDKYYFEGKVGEYGMHVIADNKGDSQGDNVFEEDQGAIIFRGEDRGLHNRVFVNSYGLPTYEAKDLGLAILKNEDFSYDKSYIVTGNEINDYFKVVLKALHEINPDLAHKTTHIGHGMLKLESGKMSSRTGDVISGLDVLDETREAVLTQMEESDTTLLEDEKNIVADQLAVGAVKYSILKHSPGKDIIYDKERLISITGDTGPYLQYSHARANSVLENATGWDYDMDLTVYELGENMSLNEKERELLRYLHRFYEAIDKSTKESAPNVICDYLLDLTQKFNSFYNDTPILEADTEAQKDLRLQITKKYRETVKTGLWLLGIEAPQQV